jgi:glucan-binding YG repeat protein
MTFQQLSSFPQKSATVSSYPQWRYITEAGVPTPFQSSQVIEKKEENTVFHRVAPSLSTNPNLINYIKRLT